MNRVEGPPEYSDAAFLEVRHWGFYDSRLSYRAEKGNRRFVTAMAKLILGSSSPRRRELLASLGVYFDVASPDVAECCHPADPVRTVRENAMAKFDALKPRIQPGQWVLTADTVVFFEGRCLLKPVSIGEAEVWLASMAGREHRVYTGFVLGRVGEAPHLDHGLSIVVFKSLTTDDIRRYLAEVNPLDKAGGYDINDHGDLLVERCEGSVSNVSGLPLERLSPLLRAGGLL